MATKYRDLEARSLIDVGARSTTTGGADAARSLSDSFRAFSRVASDVGSMAQEFAARKQAQQGEKEGLAGNPNLRHGVRSMTKQGRAYNSAAEAGYSAKVQADIDETMTAIERETESDLDTFTARSKTYADTMIEQAPEELRDRIGLLVNARIAAGGERIRNQVISDTRSQAHADFLSSMPGRAANALAVLEQLSGDEGDAALAEVLDDNKAQIQALLDEHVITPVQAAQYAAQFHTALDKGLQAARTDGVVQQLTNLARNDVQAGDAALAALDGRKDLSDEDKNAIRKSYREERELLTFERSRTHAQESADLAQRLAAGAFGDDVEASALSLYKSGAIGAPEYADRLAQSTRNSLKKAEDEVDMSAIQEALAGGRGLDPTDKKQAEALDKLFQAGATANGLTPGDPRWQASAVQIAQRTNVLPASAQSWARVNMMSGDPDQAVQGAAFFARVREAKPGAWDYNDDPRIAAFAEQINANVASGVVTEKAFDMANKNVYGLTDQQKTILADRYRADNVAKDNPGELQSDLDSDDSFDRSIFRGAPKAPLAMQAEYDELVKKFYTYTDGDIEKAREMASTSVRSMYGYTQVNGAPELIKYAPEKVYPGMTPEIIREDVANTLTTSAIALDPKTVHLTPNAFTETTKGRVWQLTHVDEFGGMDVVRDAQNKPLLYELPLGETFEAARKRIGAQKISEAAAAREADIKHKTEFDALQEQLQNSFEDPR